MPRKIKDTLVIIALDKSDKDKIKNYASELGLSISSFMLSTTLQKINRELKK